MTAIFWDGGTWSGSGEPPTPPPLATGATDGTPGTWTPAGSTPIPTLTALQASTVVASPNTAWTGFVVLGDNSEATWDGAQWIMRPPQ